MNKPLNFPALHASHAGIWIADVNGQINRVSKGEAVGRAAETPMIMLNAPLVAQRLGYAELSGMDLLELFAFVHPAMFMVPTPKGLSDVLGMEWSESSSRSAEDMIPRLYQEAAEKLLMTLASPQWLHREGAWDTSQALIRLRWPWANAVLQYLKTPSRPERGLFSRLPEWEEKPPRPAPRQSRDRAARTRAAPGAARRRASAARRPGRARPRGSRR